MNQELARLTPTPTQLAAYCGGIPDEYMTPPEVSQVEFSCIVRGRRSAKNSFIVPVEKIGAVIDEGRHFEFPFITCISKEGKRMKAQLDTVLDNLFDLTVNGWVVYSYRAETVEHA